MGDAYQAVYFFHPEAFVLDLDDEHSLDDRKMQNA
jgi:hypothetical protein